MGTHGERRKKSVPEGQGGWAAKGRFVTAACVGFKLRGRGASGAMAIFSR